MAYAIHDYDRSICQKNGIMGYPQQSYYMFRVFLQILFSFLCELLANALNCITDCMSSLNVKHTADMYVCSLGLERIQKKTNERCVRYLIKSQNVILNR